MINLRVLGLNGAGRTIDQTAQRFVSLGLVGDRWCSS